MAQNEGKPLQGDEDDEEELDETVRSHAKNQCMLTVA